MTNIYDILEELSQQHEGTDDFTYFYEEECDNRELIELICKKFNLDPNDEDMDYHGAFMDIIYNLDYQEMDYLLFIYGEYEKEATQFIEEFIEDNYEDLKEKIEEYLEESE
jgi:hypothetical protein